MYTNKSLVEISHEMAETLINKGDKVIDATVGNGFDTCFLAEQVGKKGHVFGFDLQEQAIKNTRKYLKNIGVLDRVTLFNVGHESMFQHIPKVYIEEIKSVFFNLGYLPGFVNSSITKPETTLLALNMAWRLITNEGFISIIYYPGHSGGEEESQCVKSWVSNNKTKYIYYEFNSQSENRPGCFIIGKYPYSS